MIARSKAPADRRAAGSSRVSSLDVRIEIDGPFFANVAREQMFAIAWTRRLPNPRKSVRQAAGRAIH